MALSFYTDSDASISFEQFLQAINKTLKPENEESLLACAEPLLLLANNAEFFLDYLNENLDSETGKKEAAINYSEQNYMLHNGENYFIRMTYWPMLPDSSQAVNDQNAYFSYGFVHDHNFPLLTAGYKGEGYRTKIWEYDREQIVGYPGERVDLKFLEETKLSHGKALYYRPSQDIHSQYAPTDEDSFAINIIPKWKTPNRQFEFNPGKGTIQQIMYGGPIYESKFSMLKLARYVHNAETIHHLYNLAASHESTLIRQESLNSLFKIQGSKSVWQEALENSDQLIRRYAQAMLDKA